MCVCMGVYVRGGGRWQGCIRMFPSHSASSRTEVTAVSEVVKAVWNDSMGWFEPPRKINPFL